MVDNVDLKKRIETEDDFIKHSKTNNSLKKFLAKNPDGADNKLIAKMLLMTEEQVEAIYQECVVELREELGDD